MGILKWFGLKSKAEKIQDFLHRGAIVIDVRSKTEFQSGHVRGSENIPLNQIPNRMDAIAKRNKPVITVCRSGARSGRAASMLKSNGIDVINGGPWPSVERVKNAG